MTPVIENFGEAIQVMKQGFKVARKGWNGKNMWAILVTERNYTVDAVRSGSHSLRPFFGLKDVNDNFGAWVPSTSDILAEDWYVVV